MCHISDHHSSRGCNSPASLSMGDLVNRLHVTEPMGQSRPSGQARTQCDWTIDPEAGPERDVIGRCLQLLQAIHFICRYCLHRSIVVIHYTYGAWLSYLLMESVDSHVDMRSYLETTITVAEKKCLTYFESGTLSRKTGTEKSVSYSSTLCGEPYGGRDWLTALPHSVLKKEVLVSGFFVLSPLLTPYNCSYLAVHIKLSL